MGFLFFGSKKEQSIPVKNKVLFNKAAKWQVCKELFESNPETLFVAWFEDSAAELKAVLKGETENAVLLASRPGFHLRPGAKLIFVERYPLKNREQEFFKTMRLSEVTCYCSLDDALMEYFGSKKIISLMEKLGMKENEIIESSMIDNSLERAQEELNKKILVERTAGSQKEWMERNSPAN